MTFKHASADQKTAYKAGAALAVVALVVMLLPATESWRQPGTDNIGHTDIACVDCHADAPGSLPGQVLASMSDALGRRDDPAWFGRRPTGNRQCLDCHENETDRHPVDGLLDDERFDEAVAAIQPHLCVSCHAQHQGGRADVEYGMCRYCHREMAVDDDPIDVPHEQLAREDRWDTCFGCHDYHGNHMDDTPTRMAKMYTREQVEDYFHNGRSPYGNRRLTVMQTMKLNRE